MKISKLYHSDIEISSMAALSRRSKSETARSIATIDSGVAVKREPW